MLFSIEFLTFNGQLGTVNRKVSPTYMGYMDRSDVHLRINSVKS